MNQPFTIVARSLHRSNKAKGEGVRINGQDANNYVEFKSNTFNIVGSSLAMNGVPVNIVANSTLLTIGTSVINTTSVKASLVLANGALQIGGNATVNASFVANSTMIGANTTGAANTAGGVLRVEVNGTAKYLQLFTNPGA
jgi:ADP-glucose pyrophosphorylase